MFKKMLLILAFLALNLALTAIVYAMENLSMLHSDVTKEMQESTEQSQTIVLKFSDKPDKLVKISEEVLNTIVFLKDLKDDYGLSTEEKILEIPTNDILNYDAWKKYLEQYVNNVDNIISGECKIDKKINRLRAYIKELDDGRNIEYIKMVIDNADIEKRALSRDSMDKISQLNIEDFCNFFKIADFLHIQSVFNNIFVFDMIVKRLGSEAKDFLESEVFPFELPPALNKKIVHELIERDLREVYKLLHRKCPWLEHLTVYEMKFDENLRIEQALLIKYAYQYWISHYPLLPLSIGHQNEKIQEIYTSLGSIKLDNWKAQCLFEIMQK